MQNVRTIPQTAVLKLPPQKYAHVCEIARYAFVVIWLSSTLQVPVSLHRPYNTS